MPISPIGSYLQKIESALVQGQATEHTHRPALKALVEEMLPGVQATNEPKHVACGAPDFLVTKPEGGESFTLGYIETKDVGIGLDQVERSEQLKRYLSGLRNLILTDYLEFRWYVDGELRLTARLAGWNGSKLAKLKDGPAGVEELLKHFLAHTPQPINTPGELARRLARLAHLIRDSVLQAFQQGQASAMLHDLRKGFAEILIAGLDQPEKAPEFADMFAQTLAYGLFSARIMDITPDFSIHEAQKLIPRTNPFLRTFFGFITGPDLDDEPFAGYVNDLVALLANTDMLAVLADFGKRTRQEDPIVHFYETFLAAYDPRLRELRGVYYTPQPVVSFIVRAIDDLLKTRFNLPDGLADTATVSVPDPTPGAPKGAKKPLPKVLLLDPAAGTATFPYTVIDLIRSRFMQRNNAGLWQSYVREQLLPRLHGFELLIAPYAVAHFKLAMQLAGLDLPPEQRAAWAYAFGGNERLNIFLTNTLDEPHEYAGLPLFGSFLAEETRQANRVKQDLPVMVVLGNPPYAVASSNTGKWITDLVRGSYYPKDEIKEANLKMLLDDYVKFIRWSQWRIEQTGAGILGFITNNGYLDNPTFRGMRQSLMQTFDEIYLLDLHGSTLKKETAPDGGKDENVFDIQQGVSIGIFVKLPAGKPQTKGVYHAYLYGLRSAKYAQLEDMDLQTTPWQKVIPQAPFYLFKPQDAELLPEYEKGWKLTDIFHVYSTGIKTHRDHFALDFDFQILSQRIGEFRNLAVSDEAISKKYNLTDTRDWKLHLRRFSLSNNDKWQSQFENCLYRPFDSRSIYFDADVIELPRPEVMEHMRKPNLALLYMRRIRTNEYQHVFVTNQLIGKDAVSIEDACSVSPLYLYSDETSKKYQQTSIFENSSTTSKRFPNLNSEFVIGFSNRLGLSYSSEACGDLQTTFGPEDIFHYIYAILHSPTYRSRYAEFLKIDFPRIPLTSDAALFRRLCGLGAQLTALHLLEAPQVNQFVTSYPAPGDNRVERGYPRYVEPTPQQPQGRVYINPNQYFEGVPPQVWQFHIGGYQVLDKWLKDRRGRLLTFQDLSHYQKVVVALQETIRLMAEIDAAIPKWPVE